MRKRKNLPKRDANEYRTTRLFRKTATFSAKITCFCAFLMIYYVGMYTVRIVKRYFACGEYIRTLRLISKLIDLRVGYAKWCQELCS